MQTGALEKKFLKIRSNKIFEIFIVSIIIFPAMVVGVKTYDIPPTVGKIVSILYWLITVIFFNEITIRFLGEERKRDFFKAAGISVIPLSSCSASLLSKTVAQDGRNDNPSR